VDGNTKVAGDLLVVHFDEGLHSAAYCKDSVGLLGDANIVERPEVEVVGLEELEESSIIRREARYGVERAKERRKSRQRITPDYLEGLGSVWGWGWARIST